LTQSNFYKNNIERLESQLAYEKTNSKKIIQNFEGKESEYSNIQKDLDKVKEVYESKIKSLNNKIQTDEENLQELKLQIKQRNDVKFNLTPGYKRTQ
jgi:chromosome segregation ATPase